MNYLQIQFGCAIPFRSEGLEVVFDELQDELVPVRQQDLHTWSLTEIMWGFNENGPSQLVVPLSQHSSMSFFMAPIIDDVDFDDEQ